MKKACPVCGINFDGWSKDTYCSRACYLNRIPPEERFWSKVNKAGPVPPHRPELGPCWVWTACRSSSGYGFIRRDGRNLYVHRISWESSVGPIPDDMLVLHKCDNRLCVRPSHLFLGTHADNSDDKIRKGRDWHLEAEGHTHAKLTVSKILEGRRLYMEGDYSITQLAGWAGVDRMTFYKAFTGRTWKSVEPPPPELLQKLRSKSMRHRAM